MVQALKSYIFDLKNGFDFLWIFKKLHICANCLLRLEDDRGTKIIFLNNIYRQFSNNVDSVALPN